MQFSQQLMQLMPLLTWQAINYANLVTNQTPLHPEEEANTCPHHKT